MREWFKVATYRMHSVVGLSLSHGNFNFSGLIGCCAIAGVLQGSWWWRLFLYIGSTITFERGVPRSEEDEEDDEESEEPPETPSKVASVSFLKIAVTSANGILHRAKRFVSIFMKRHIFGVIGANFIRPWKCSEKNGQVHSHAVAFLIIFSRNRHRQLRASCMPILLRDMTRAIRFRRLWRGTIPRTRRYLTRWPRWT